MDATNIAMPDDTPKSKLSGWAVASVILPLTCVFAFFGLICGIVGFVRINGSEGRLHGKGLAIAGITLSSFAMLLSLAVLPALLLPVLGRARESAKRVASAANMRMIHEALLASQLDAGDNKLPADPYTLYPKFLPDSRVFRCQRYPNEPAGYVYVSGLNTSDSQAILLYENVPTTSRSYGRNVLRAGGTVEFLQEAEFQRDLERTKSNAAAANLRVKEIPIDQTKFR
jgi:hypothetical protein